MRNLVYDAMRAAAPIVLTLGAALWNSPVVGAASEWPTVSGDATTSRECVDAERLAYGTFHSTARRMYAPGATPDGMESRLILGALELDISGGRALSADKKHFDEMPQLGDSSNRSLFWGKPLDNGVRLVVTESAVGWRGDRYALFVLDNGIEPPALLQDLQQPYEKRIFQPLIGETWRPPLVFEFNAGGTPPWFVVVGEPYEVLGRWAVFQAMPGGYAQRCTISFRPEGVTGVELLPTPVREFVKLLDETLGPGLNEGTLHLTASLRLDIQHLWANAALRPWALSETDVYNSREEVDAGLKDWARGARSFAYVYTQIQRSYPRAERSLQLYYEREFHMSKSRADRLAGWVLDLGYRGNFVFSNGGDYFRYDGVNSNPWGRP